MTHSLGVAAAAILIIGAAVLLIMNWDKIAVKEPDKPSVSSVTTSSATDPVNIWDDKIPEFETETDRLKRLYPEMFDLLPASIGLSLAYKTNDSGEWTYTLYDTDDMISFALEHPGEKYDMDSIHFMER